MFLSYHPLIIAQQPENNVDELIIKQTPNLSG